MFKCLLFESILSKKTNIFAVFRHICSMYVAKKVLNQKLDQSSSTKKFRFLFLDVLEKPIQ